MMQFMNTSQDLRDMLKAFKGGGRWSEIAALAGISYNYLTRIARNKATPSYDIGVALFAAIAATAPKSTARSKPAPSSS